MEKEKPAFWFYAKSFGWGWGLPATWQGWLILITFIFLVIGTQFLDLTPGYRLGLIIALTIVLIIVVSIKGEKPLRWRWGDD